MSRAILLPTTGDPYVAGIWLSSYKKFWQDSGAKLYVCLNSGIDEVVMDYTESLFKEVDATILRFDGLVDHGGALTKLLDLSTEDYIFIAEEDYHTLSPGHINNWFSLVETNPNTAVVSYRGSADFELMKRTREHFNITDPLLQNQTNFWPSLVCIHRSALEKTDKWFSSKAFNQGEYIKELDWVVPNVQCCGDTFVWASIQLRSQGLNFIYENQWRLCDVIHKGPTFSPPWIHIGSTSMTVNGALLDKDMRTLNNRKKLDTPSKYPPPNGGIHFEQIAAFWYYINATYQIPQDNQAYYFNNLYKTAIDGFTTACLINKNNISKYYMMYKKLLNALS